MTTGVLLCFMLVTTPCLIHLHVKAFSPLNAAVSIQRTSVSFPLALSSPSSSSNEENEEERRMELVRQLQKTFYQSSTTDDEPYLEESTGRMCNLPLWRVGWVEVPGRANCLNVHEGHYTNMFEKLLASSLETKYFGHLHLKKSVATKTDSMIPTHCNDLPWWEL
jgi:hypothetical protein